jgi:hypothetical protein
MIEPETEWLAYACVRIPCLFPVDELTSNQLHRLYYSCSGKWEDGHKR